MKFTQAPYPQIRNLFHACLLKETSSQRLSAPWCREGDISYWLSKSAWSLEVIVRWRQKLTHKQNIAIWIPDYFCNESLENIRNMGVELFLYPITEGLVPDIDACIAASNHTSLDVFVHVHYFGQVRDIEASSVFCKTQDAWLVEDAAHVFRPVSGVGEVGDFVLYSVHKHLPIPDGALLVIRSKGVSELKVDKSSLALLDDCLASQKEVSPERSNISLVLWLLKRIAQRFGVRARLHSTRWDMVVENEGSESIHSGMSSLSKRLLGALLPQLDHIEQKRKKNAISWSIVLGVSGRLVQNNVKVDDAVTPYLVPFQFSNDSEKSEVFKRLQLSGVPVTTWPDLPPEVMASQSHHSAAIGHRLGHLFLPVHHSLSPRDISDIGMREFSQETRLWTMREIEKKDYDFFKKKCHKSNFLQSWEYGSAKEDAENWKAKRFLIKDGNRRPVALLQVLVRSLPGIGGVARINRGPLIISADGVDIDLNDRINKVLSALFVVSQSMLRHRWWFLRAAVEIPDSEACRQGMHLLGFKRKGASAWASGYLDLSLDENDLLMGFRGKWRNAMRKGKKLGVMVHELPADKANIQLLLKKYSELQNSRGFDGLSDKLLHGIVTQTGDDWKCNLFEAVEVDQSGNNRHLGMLVSLHAGDTAIYLIGYTNEEGRKMQANSVLLWQAISRAKSCGCRWFDIGGLSGSTPGGIAHFKKGLNAKPYKLVGEWSYSPTIYKKIGKSIFS